MYKWHALILLLCFTPQVSSACSCVFDSKITEAMVLHSVCAAEHVLTGYVENSTKLRDDGYEFRIRPDVVIKGEVQTPIYAVSWTGGACGYPFQVGRKYVIFANRHANTQYLAASICGYTSEYSSEYLITRTINAIDESIEDLCSSDAHAKRRLEIIREKFGTANETENAARENVDPE